MSENDEEELRSNEDCPVLNKLPAKLLGRLLPFQKEGVRFAVNKNGRCLIADEMGLGKTLQAISVAYYYKDEWPLLYYKDEWPLLIIVPSSLKFCWIEELEKWLPDILPHQINLVQCGSDASGIANSPITIITYGLLRIPSSRVIREAISTRKFKVVICDESHYLKNYKTLSSKTIVPLVKAANRRLLLSGTPALSKPVELYPQIDAICPGRFGSFWQYTDKYCDARTLFFGKIRQRKVDGASNLEELQQKLQSMLMIRREKSEVLKELPPKQRQRILFDLKQSNVKKDILERFSTLKERIHKGDKKLENILQGRDNVQGQQEEESHILDENGIPPSEESPVSVFSQISKLYKLSGEAKIGPVREYIEMLCDNEQLKFLVFAYHYDMMDGIQQTLQDHKIKFVRIDGCTKGLDRQAYVTQFQSDPDTRVAILSILAAGVGLTFTEAKLVVFAELYWTPGVMVQCEDRAHRIGQTCSLPVHYLVAKDTMDEWVWSAVCKKTVVTSTALTGKSRQLEHSEGDKYQIELLSNAEAWQTEEGNSDISVSELIKSQRPADQSSILKFFSSQSERTAPSRKRKHSFNSVDPASHLWNSSKTEEGHTKVSTWCKNCSDSVENDLCLKSSKNSKSKLETDSSTSKSDIIKLKLSEAIIIVSDEEDEFKPITKKQKKIYDTKSRRENKEAKSDRCNDKKVCKEAKSKQSSVRNNVSGIQNVSKSEGYSFDHSDTDAILEFQDNNLKLEEKESLLLNNEGLSENSKQKLLEKSKDLDYSIVGQKTKTYLEHSLSNIEMNSKSQIQETTKCKVKISSSDANSKASLRENSSSENSNKEGTFDSLTSPSHDGDTSVQPKLQQFSEIYEECATKPTSPKHIVQGEATPQWSCSQCTFLNHLDLPQCEVCDTPKKKASRKQRKHLCKSQDVSENLHASNSSKQNCYERLSPESEEFGSRNNPETASSVTSVGEDINKNEDLTSVKDFAASRCQGDLEASLFHPLETDLIEQETSVTSHQEDSVHKSSHDENQVGDSTVPKTIHDNSLHVDDKMRHKGSGHISPDLFEEEIVTNSEKSEAIEETASLIVHKVLKFSCSVYTGRVFVYDGHEQSLQTNFHPIDIEVGNMGDLPSFLQHPHHQRLLQKFVREWSSLTDTKKKLIAKRGLIFSSPLAAYNEVKTVTGNNQRHRTKQDSLITALKKAKDVQGTVRVISKHSSAPIHISASADDKDSSSIQGLAQTVTEEGVPLCLQCQEPYKNPLLSSKSISRPENAWQLRLCSFACMDKFWTLTKAGYCRDQIYDIEHGVCRLCQFDAHSFFTRLKITKDVKIKADLINKSPYSVMASNLKRKMMEQPQAGQFWHVDHITPVWQGGGMCDLDNMRTLCTPCHLKVTRKQAGQRANVKKLSAAANVGDITAFFQRL